MSIHNPFDFTAQIPEWATYLKSIRRFFDERAFFEVSTAQLVNYGAFESTIDPLKVSFSDGEGELHTSPEIEMKVLLAKTRLPIYQICKCFRDDPHSPIHGKEFTMLEFYRPEGALATIQNDMSKLLGSLSNTAVKLQEYSIYDLVLKITGIDLKAASTEELLHQEIKKRSTLLLSDGDSWEDIFFKILLEKVEPVLDPKIPILLKDYPARVSPLSKSDPNTGIAERFEIYWKGMEICNGCVELVDENLLKKRYQSESEARKKNGKVPHPVPNKLFESARTLPPSAGVAVGLDRLFLCLSR